MSTDPLAASMSRSGREFLARIGRRFGTREVQAQARHTLAALDRLGPQLRDHGFGEDDARLLAAASEAAAARRREVKVTDSAYVFGLDQAKSSRGRARSVLLCAYRRLRMTGGPEARPAMELIEGVITTTSGPGGDDRIYAAELERLLETLRDAGVREAVAASGGAEVEAKVEAALATLAQLDAELAAGGEADPEELEADAIDGMIVELVRMAHFAAKAAAMELGDRTLAKEFRLRLLG